MRTETANSGPGPSALPNSAQDGLLIAYPNVTPREEVDQFAVMPQIRQIERNPPPGRADDHGRGSPFGGGCRGLEHARSTVNLFHNASVDRAAQWFTSRYGTSPPQPPSCVTASL